MANITTDNFDARKYKREYEQDRRALARGFNMKLARRLHSELLARGLSLDDARWCILDAAARGCFGFTPETLAISTVKPGR